MQNKQISSETLSKVIWKITSFKKQYADFAIFFASQLYQDLNSMKTSYSKLNGYFEKHKITPNQSINLINTYKYVNRYDLEIIETYLKKHQEFQAKQAKILKMVTTEKLPTLNSEKLEKKRKNILKISKEDFGYFLRPLLTKYYELGNNLEVMIDIENNITLHNHIYNLIESNSEEENGIKYISVEKNKSIFNINL